MAHRTPSALQAVAGPRIHAPRRGAEAWLQGGQLLEHQLQQQSRTAEEAAEMLLLHLRDDPLALLPWSLDRQDPVRHVGWTIGATFASPVLVLLLGLPWWISTALFGIGLFVVLRLLEGSARRTAMAAREVTTELEHGTLLHELEDELLHVVQEAPELDGARFMLAQLRLEQGDAMSALMQLAPLRDRHPDQGAVVLLAALAYAQLGATADAVRMLEVLQVESVDAWSEEVARFHEICVGMGFGGVRASSGDLDTDV